jgi:hypothetical protein
MSLVTRKTSCNGTWEEGQSYGMLQEGHSSRRILLPYNVKLNSQKIHQVAHLDDGISPENGARLKRYGNKSGREVKEIT